ncbi:ATP-binding protein [Trichocoleus sp. FACHB-591]|uniref:ATP-binding protein n=1 Tax=Trichocoleus sp. FACHB-591 TaxID=2692872 RepID=UPI0016845671|nr:ATP-binding protein [Trichocoleus sp. FACHB-591]MBD2094493.1 ATP-binding protein [Trichocoleus sp. FACHB-591]
MDAQTVASVQFIQRQAASLLLYQFLFEEEVGRRFVELLQALRHTDVDGLACVQAYGRWFQSLAASNQGWQEYLLMQLLKADNPFSRRVQQTELTELPPALVTAARHDLRVLQTLYGCTSYRLSQWVQVIAQLPAAPVSWVDDLTCFSPAIALHTDETMQEQLLITKLQTMDDWSDALEDLAAYYQRFGTGFFAEYCACRWQAGKLAGIAHPDPIRLTDLVGYEAAREALMKNTAFLLSGYPALHVLLYGSRGSGKSSLVKALLNEYSDLGLRLIEVAKSDLKELPVIVEQLRNLPQKFIVFVDDLSFEEDDDAFKSLKVVLEGNLTARAQNVVVYATSNRRHLVREFFGDRPRPKDSDEIHNWDTVQEKLSFSDRFGLTLTFEPANQDVYLQMVRHLAVQAGIAISREELEFQALQWATRHNGRSGRTARQFIDFLQADLALSS